MAITFDTASPEALLKAFDDRIKQTEQKGKITTWEKHRDGTHYTHKAEDWRNKAFLKSAVHQGKLVFNIIAPKDGAVSSAAYAYYHGHLIETFLNHFDTQFFNASASAMPIAGDLVKA